MRLKRGFNTDLETVKRFLDVLGGSAVVLGSTNFGRPGFFIYAHGFIHDYIEMVFLRKEELLIDALKTCGFPPDDGPIGFVRADQEKIKTTAVALLAAAQHWQTGDENARSEVAWSVSQFTSTFRQHLERLKNLIFPLLEQNLTLEDEHRIAERLNTIVFEVEPEDEPDRFKKMIETLEEELRDWY
jgi:hemerythrin-like domain-containing protein